MRFYNGYAFALLPRLLEIRPIGTNGVLKLWRQLCHDARADFGRSVFRNTHVDDCIFLEPLVWLSATLAVQQLKPFSNIFLQVTVLGVPDIPNPI